MKSIWKKVTAITLLTTLLLTGCGAPANNAKADNKNANAAEETQKTKDGDKVVKIGVVGDDQRLWEKAAELAKKTASPWKLKSSPTTIFPTMPWQTAVSI